MLKRFENLITLILGAICFCFPVWSAFAVTGSEWWELKLDMTTPVLAAEPHLLLKLTLVNKSGQSLVVLDTNAMHDFEISIATASGVEVPMTAHGRELKENNNQIFTRVSQATIKNYEAMVMEVDLAPYYTLAPGNYIVRVTAKNAAAAKPLSGKTWSKPLAILSARLEIAVVTKKKYILKL